MHARRWRIAVPFIVVAAAALASYSNTFSVPFVLDDFPNIVLASRVHALALTPAALAEAAAAFPLGRWLAHVSFAANHALGGMDPVGYHAVNLAFHVAVAMLVLVMAREILARVGGLVPAAQRRAALVSALLFAVHPVHTQAVTYVVQRMTSMGAFFALLALVLWVRGRATSGRAAAACFVGWGASGFLAFSCKENFALLPVLTVLLEALLFPGIVHRLRRRWQVAASAAALLASMGALVAWRYADVFSIQSAAFQVSAGTRLLTQPRVLWLYLSLLAFPLPSRLHLDYAWTASTGLLSPPSTIAAVAGLAALITVAWAVRKRMPLLAFATAWFLVALALEQTVLPLHFVFEHRLYLPSLGWFVLAAWGLERSVSRVSGSGWLVAGPVLSALALATFVRNAEWNHPAGLYADPASQAPGHAGQLPSLGTELKERGDLDEAERAFRRALELEPGNASAFAGLASVLWDGGRKEEALELYRESLARHADIPEAWLEVTWMLVDVGRIDEAEATARRGLTAHPSFAPLRIPISACRERRGDLDGARRELEEAVRADPGLWVAWGELAQILLAEGRPADALSAAERCVSGAPADPLAHIDHGRAFAALGRIVEARAAYARALELDPADEDARRLLAAISAR